MKILVLSSGGLDSTVCLYKAVKDVGKENVHALWASYGQKHAKEFDSFIWQVRHLGIDYNCTDLSSVFVFDSSCSLLGHGDIPKETYADQLSKTQGKPVNTYVPFRNGLFLSVASSIALQLGCDVVYYGAHADDAAGNAYPDCTPDFIDAMNEAIKQGTAGAVRMLAPLWDLNKAGVVARGLELGMTHEELEHTWSCYEGGDKPCGVCGTCRDRKTAFEANNIFDII